MADIILAEHDGRVWLVVGEQHIDDLLANSLPASISIDFVQCESHSHANDMWEHNRRRTGGASTAWLIHPAIVSRIRRRVGGFSVSFGPWSALLDDTARDVVRAAADQAARKADANVVLTSYIVPDGPQLATDLAILRSSLIEAELSALGVCASRITRARRDATSVEGDAAKAECVDIEFGEA